ncbi:DUF1850 domain-containing protein [Pseudalkalibacillus salsuginis]|uniref:DUF1850 domain-containing protein n=1 Tax=Pseudalkalibacillus salsuginis TaxID=2910972 RepID=UPI001F1C9CBE|nr:DUF1850 domain-containing protein [Pseudalkalibacillus salsuginis]MCF6410846.1 DUF1850 domain-containing protein [Pseudalkalibacillus salsuginis]
MKKNTKVLASLIILIGLILIVFIPFGKVLAITFENSGNIIAYVNVDKETEFHIHYIHSVHRTPVKETYEISDNDEIVQTALAYKNFAIGMPSNATGDEKFIEKDGTYYITNMNRVFPYIDIRVGQVIANHTLIIDQKEFPLDEAVAPGSWARLDVQPINLWQRLKGDEIFG